MIINFTQTGYPSYKKLDKSSKDFYTDQVLKKVLKKKAMHSSNKYFNLRTARCTRATEWYKLVTEYRHMRWTHEPPNPLQHENEKMTKEHYSAKGVDTLQAVQ